MVQEKNNITNGRVKLFSATFILLVALFFAGSQTAEAASLYLSPLSGSYEIGSRFSTSVLVSSSDQSMNAASGVISFPTDKLEITSLTKGGSVFNFWVQEPSFSNVIGTIDFEGVVLNPGFIGPGGKILTINFRVKSGGSAAVVFSSGSVLANDGLGTNILTDLGQASFALETQVITPAAQESTTPSSVVGAPQAPEVNSSTHSDPNKWYSDSNPNFNWTVPSGITSIQMLAGRHPNSVPTVLYTTKISEKIVTDMPDGIWYFHIRFRNNEGWGPITHFRFQVDTQKPDYFDIKEVLRKDDTDPRVKFIFDAKDKTSGIDYYGIVIDGKNFGEWKDDGSHTYITPALGPGEHTMVVKAIDVAGNEIANSINFKIDSLWPPVITEYTDELESGELLFVKGNAGYPDAKITIWLQRLDDKPVSYEVISDKENSFSFVTEEKFKNGVYTLWVIVTDDRGAISDEENSERVTILIRRPPLLAFGIIAMDVLSVTIPLIALIFTLIFMLWWSKHKYNMFRKRLRKEVNEADQALHKAFDLLRIDVKEQIKLLEKTKKNRRLTMEEKKIMKILKDNLNDAEKFVAKEIEDIKNIVK